MDNWQEELGLVEAKGHIAFLQESLSTLSALCDQLAAQIGSLKLQLAATQDQRDKAVYAKLQVDEAVEALRAEMTARTALFQEQLATLQRSLDDAVNSKAQAGETLDDLESIPGIDEVFVQRLHDAGFRSYRTLAAATVEELAEICHGAPAPVAPDFAAWIAQAKTLNAERGTQL